MLRPSRTESQCRHQHLGRDHEWSRAAPPSGTNYILPLEQESASSLCLRSFREFIYQQTGQREEILTKATGKTSALTEAAGWSHLSQPPVSLSFTELIDLSKGVGDAYLKCAMKKEGLAREGGGSYRSVARLIGGPSNTSRRSPARVICVYLREMCWNF